MRPASILGAIAVAILVLLVVLWSLLDSGGAISAEDVHQRSGGVPVATHSPAAPGGLGGEAAASVSAVAQRAEVVRSTALSEQTCRIRVVLASSKTPVPDALVWLQREDVDWQSAAWKKVMRRFNDVEPVLQSGLGQELTLDARGEVCVPRPARKLSLAAARGELHGEATLGPDDAECVVELKAYHSLACVVVDRSDRPVEGAQVALYWGEFDPLEHGFTWITGADGRVWIPKLEEQLWPDGYQGSLRVSLAAGVAGEPEVVLFTTDSVPAEPVRFVAGDFGRLVVQLTDPQGTELALGGYVHVEIGWDSIFDKSLAVRGGASLHLPFDSGHAVFECVGLGLPLEISVAAEGHDNVWRDVAGPTAAGQELRVLIPIGERRANARGRVQCIRATFGDREPTGARLDGRASQVGVFFSPWVEENKVFESPIWNARELEKLDVPWTLELSHDGGPVLRATVVPTINEEGTVLDFGELVFDAEAELARLRVTDDSGAPVERARVELSPAKGTSTPFCDAGGRYLLAGQPTELPVSVRATHQTWLPSDWVEVAAPGGDHTLVLRRGAILAGQLLLPRASNFDDFELDLRVEPSPAAPEGATYAALLVEGGRFRFQACEPGRARLTVSHAERFVLERDGIGLLSGQTTELEPIDLGGVLHSFELSFELESGAPWSSGHLELLDPDGELSLWRSIGPAARAAFLAPRPSVDLWVAGWGVRPVLFENVLDGDRLTLPSAPAVVLRVSEEIRLPEPPLVLMVRGERVLPATVAFEPDEDLDVEDTIVGADGSARLRLPWPGDYELAWFVRHTGTGVLFPIEQAEPQTIHVPDSPTPAVVEAELARAEVAEAVLAAGG